MDTKFLKLSLIIVVSALFAAGASAGKDPRAELRHRLDSLNFEKQERRRQGKAIDDLDDVTAALQDTLENLRGYVPAAADDGGEPSGGGLPQFLERLKNVPFLEGSLSSFKPRGVFDWIVVGTGCVALLSGLALVLGIVAGMGKKQRVMKGAGRKINLAPTRTQAAVAEFAAANPEIDADMLPRRATPADNIGYNANAAPRDSVADLQNLMESLRKFAPPSPPQQAQQAKAPASAFEPEPEPEPESPPLVVEPPPVTKPPMFATKTQTIAVSPDAPPAGQDSGLPLPSFNELVLTASKNGLSELEISRRYQLSVDLVRLILRMSNT